MHTWWTGALEIGSMQQKGFLPAVSRLSYSKMQAMDVSFPQLHKFNAL